jgi:16S rRNA (guanine966-N2)-methyltransferase
MRIIAGTFRGRKLEGPPGMGTRPITDRAKETLFNILGARLGLPGELPEIDVLDLFAGTGGLGLEALSRGARSCLFVERDRRALTALRRNIGMLHVESACRVSIENAWTTRVPSAPADGYGLIFVDPPYKDAVAPLPVIDLLERLRPHLAPGGLIVFRHRYRTRLPLEGLRTLECVDEREVGTMRLWLLAARTSTPEAPDQA